jgi:hypothetical protein
MISLHLGSSVVFCDCLLKTLLLSVVDIILDFDSLCSSDDLLACLSQYSSWATTGFLEYYMRII